MNTNISKHAFTEAHRCYAYQARLLIYFCGQTSHGRQASQHREAALPGIRLSPRLPNSVQRQLNIPAVLRSSTVHLSMVVRQPTGRIQQHTTQVEALIYGEEDVALDAAVTATAKLKPNPSSTTIATRARIERGRGPERSSRVQ